MDTDFVLFGGTSSARLAEAVARELQRELGACSITRFPDGETSIRLSEPVRGREAVVIASTSPPVNDHLVELLAFVDACRRAGAAKITAVIPYFGYARSDRDHGHREPITASMVASVLECVGVQRVVTLDLHTPQIEGFFKIPVDALTALAPLAEEVRAELPADAVVVAPDAGRVTLATKYAERLGLPLAILHKQRLSGTATRVRSMVGDVRDRTCLVVDDMISTGGTLIEGAAALREEGAVGFVAAATHALLLSDAPARLADAGFSRLVVTDTVAHPVYERGISVVSVAPLLARAIASR